MQKKEEQAKDEIRASKRTLKSAEINMDRELEKLKTQIKNEIFSGRDPKLYAKQYSKLLEQRERLAKAIGQLHTVENKMSSIKASESMMNAMCSATKAMTVMNRKLDMEKMSRIVNGFENSSTYSSLKEEEFDAHIDELLENSADETESSQYMNKLMDSIGLDISQSLDGVPSKNLEKTLANTTELHSPIKKRFVNN